MKSLRQRLEEQGLLEPFLKQHPHNQASKYFPVLAGTTSSEPLQNYMNVSVAPAWSPWGCGPLTVPHAPIPSPFPLLSPCLTLPTLTERVLRHHLHWHASPGVHCHLRHRLLQPVGAVCALSPAGHRLL